MIGHCPEFIEERTSEFLGRDRAEKRTLYMIYGTEDSPRVTGFVHDFQKTLEAGAMKGFRSRLEILDGEGHVPASSLCVVSASFSKRIPGGAVRNRRRPGSPGRRNPSRGLLAR